MGHRYYDPGTGRFLTRDPIGYGGGMNLYGFADDNPVNESDPNGTDVGSPGFFESLIPVWGSGRETVHDYQNGKWGWGIFNTTLAISDVFLVKAAVVDVVKVGFKGLVKVGGSHSWSATKTWMIKNGWRDYKGQHFHHWMLEQSEGIGKNAPTWLKNQPWNLKGIPQSLAQRYGVRPFDIHNAIHGDNTLQSQAVPMSLSPLKPAIPIPRRRTLPNHRTQSGVLHGNAAEFRGQFADFGERWHLAQGRLDLVPDCGGNFPLALRDPQRQQNIHHCPRQDRLSRAVEHKSRKRQQEKNSPRQ